MTHSEVHELLDAARSGATSSSRREGFKRKTIIAALILLFMGTAHAVDSDKKMHMGVSFVLGFAMANQFPNEPLKAWGVAMVPGLIKEVGDRSTTGFDPKDLAANAIGAALGVATGKWMVTRNNGTTQVAYVTQF